MAGQNLRYGQKGQLPWAREFEGPVKGLFIYHKNFRLPFKKILRAVPQINYFTTRNQLTCYNFFDWKHLAYNMYRSRISSLIQNIGRSKIKGRIDSELEKQVYMNKCIRANS